ncbi:hypothetical protein E2562_029560 [Oryza meyeriana var. granulata]|uniref:Uncharacterized protein n=1 Tax=Oryza meyeriana var. granulata TaxID=110450 RepID=A0A6G1C9M4_9ORYZ|nr:hypothetical protein E2562_029560 [Oryza meyeriana var. granulata]
MEVITVCALLLLTLVLVLVCLKQLAVVACFHVLIIYLGRFVLLHGGDDRLRCFRIKVAVGILYLTLSAILFCLFGPVMPPWGAVAAWAMSLAAIELGYAFFFPYSCYHIDDEHEEMMINPTVGVSV